MTEPKNRRVLLIDDTAAVHEDFRKILTRADSAPGIDAAEEALFGAMTVAPRSDGFDLDSAYQGHEGLEKVRASMTVGLPYAMAFVDMRMPPGWDGVETIQEIWKIDPRLQIVICTAYSDCPWDEVLGVLGIEDRLLVLKKPFDSIEVAQMARTLTTKWDMTRQAEMKVSRLEAAVQARTSELDTANQELEALVDEAMHRATHDALTGLPNRILFVDRAVVALAAAPRAGTRPVVAMLDLDRFKEVNDTLGHLHGDLLLRQVADRLSAALRPGDTVARFGGDEFVILLADGGREAGTSLAGRIAVALEAPFFLGEISVGVEVSIGIAVAADGELSTVEEMLRQADVAMYTAKLQRSGFAHFSAGHDDDNTKRRLSLIGELRHALDRDELVLFYQPQIAVETGVLLGVEALVRWQHPTRGLLAPAEFLAAAEGSSLIQPLTLAVIDKALRFCRGWLDQGVRLPVAVNVSGRSLFRADFPSLIKDRLAHAQVAGDLLTIELNEGSAMSFPAGAVDVLTQLRAMGVRLSVDDYGTGYSSMAYLKDLPVNELKIDREFVAGLIGDHRDAVIVRSAITLSHDLGLSIVAEGVEDPATLAALEELGVDVAQGFHLGRPMSEDLIPAWIAARQHRVA